MLIVIGLGLAKIAHFATICVWSKEVYLQISVLTVCVTIEILFRFRVRQRPDRLSNDRIQRFKVKLSKSGLEFLGFSYFLSL